MTPCIIPMLAAAQRRAHHSHSWVRSLGAIASAMMLILGIGCATAPGPSFPREEAVRKATADASASAPEISPVQVRIDAVTAELTTLGDSNRRRGLPRSNSSDPGRDQNTPVWWVNVAGYFQFQGMAAPSTSAGERYEATERTFIYDARTGEAIGAQIPHSRPLAATPGPATPATTPPCATPVPALSPDALRLMECNGTGPTAKLYDPFRQASPVAGVIPSTTRQSYALTPGPQTRGAMILVGGRNVQLPQDTYVSGYEPYVECTVGKPCPDPPIYELRRGPATLRIEARSGTVIEETIVPGDAGAFDFLREDLW
jgi:hypothetical protein